MVSREVSEAIHKMESTFDKKIEQILSVRGNLNFVGTNDNPTHNFAASDPIKTSSTSNEGKNSFYSWLRTNLLKK